MSTEHKPDNDDQNRSRERRELKELLEPVMSSSRVSRAIINSAFIIFIYAYCVIGYLTDEKMRNELKDRELRDFLLHRESRVGLLENSIIGSEIYHPDPEGTTLLRSQASAVGKQIAYDFHRPEEFGPGVKKRGRQLQRGRIYAFPLDEIIDNCAADYTPTPLLQVLSLQHFLHFETLSLPELEQLEMVRKTTYAGAYKRAGLYDRYEKRLTLSGIADRSVYQVTPKGNSLILLSEGGGSTLRKEVRQATLKPVTESI